MRASLIIFFLLVVTTAFSQSPGLQWLGIGHGDNTKFFNQVATDNDGGVYTVGGFFGEFDADLSDGGEFILNSQGQGDALIIKHNSAGAFEWAYTFGNDIYQDAYTLAVDTDGNIIVGGSFEGTVDFDAGTGVEEYTPPSMGAYLMKISSAGDLIWIKPFFGPDGFISISSISIDPLNNNIFVGGIIQGTIDSDPGTGIFPGASAGASDIWFAKFETDGDFITAVITGGPGEDYVEKITLDASNQLVAMGLFSGIADLHPGPTVESFNATTNSDIFIMKLDNALGYVWAKQVTSTAFMEVGGLACDPGNNIVFNGTINGTTDFDPGTGVVNLPGNNGDLFLAKFKPDGSLDWAKGAGTTSFETGKTLDIDASGNIFAAGRYGQEFDINPDGAITDLVPTSPWGGWTMYVTKFSTTGDLLWYHTVPSGDTADPEYLNIDDDDNIFIVGDFSEEVDFTFNTCLDGNRVTYDNALPFLLMLTPTSDPACFGFFQQPEPFAVGCDEQDVRLSAPAGGAYNIKYQWQMFDGSVWDNIIDDDADAGENGYAGAQTPYLTISAVLGGDQGDVRCMVTANAVPTIYSNTVTFEIKAVPGVPGLTATSGCGPAYYAMQAFSSLSADYKWYIGHDDDGTFEADELVEGENGDSFSRFFDEDDIVVAVSQFNGGCEGDKAMVAINTQTCAQPPGLVWARQLSPGLIQPTTMAIDDFNDVYIAGEFYSAADFDPGAGNVTLTPNGTSDYFIAKYSPAGTLYWAKQTDMSIADLEVGGGDDVYYVGNFTGTVDFDPGAAAFTMTAAAGSQDIAIVELHSDGTFAWAKQIAGLSGVNGNFGRAITEGPNEEIYITGNFTRTMDFNPDPAPGATANLTSLSTGGPDIFVARYDEDGNYLWAKRMGSTAFVERGHDIKVDATGNVYTVGVFQSTVDFNPDPATPAVFNLTSAGATDAFIQKLDAAGTFVWAKQFGASSSDEALALDLDATGNPIVVGAFNGTVDFDPNAGIFNISAGARPAFIVKLAGDGTLIWAKQSGGQVEDVHVASGNKVLLTGTFADDADFDPSPSTNYILRTAVDTDVFVSHLDASGNFLWAYNTNASGLNYFANTGSVVDVDGTGDIYVTGYFNNTADFDPTNCTYPMTTAASGGREVFIQKIRPGLATICFSLQPEDVAACDGSETHFIAQATGTTNITYQWQYFDTMDGSFQDLNASAGISGVDTNELIINATASLGEGIYRVFVAGDNANDETSFESEFEVTETPDGPTFDPVNFCSTGVKTLIVDGGTDGNYRWYENTSSAPIDGEVNGAFTTPFLSASTTYYVTSIVDECESDFTTVDAPINLTIAPPAVIDGVSCTSPASVTLTASGATGGDNYYWYRNIDDTMVMEDSYSETQPSPIISSTTSFYVAIGDGFCESERVEVLGRIGSSATPTATTVNNCGPGAITLTAGGGADGNYRWYEQSSGGTAIAGAVNASYVTPTLTSTTPYFVSIDDGSCESIRVQATAVVDTPPAAPTANGASVCTNAAAALSATSSITGVFRWYATASDVSPIQTGASFNTPNLSITTTYYVTVFDTKCESLRTAVIVTVATCATNAPPVITSTVTSADIAGTATINLIPLLSDPDNNLDLSTLKIIVQPKSGAKATIDQNGQLLVDYSSVAFSGEDELTIEICDLAGSCVQQVIRILVSGEIFVYNAVSPNGDGKNEEFHIASIDVIAATRENTVTIFNRWGDVVFSVDNYDNKTNVFIGKNNNGNELPSGTYFYRIKYGGDRKPETGYLSLKR